jgi:hypothetical protein
MSRRSHRGLIRQPAASANANQPVARRRVLSCFVKLHCYPSFWGAACITRVMDNIALLGEPFDSRDVYVKGYKYRRCIFVLQGRQDRCLDHPG